MSLIPNAQAAAALEQHVDRVAAGLVEAVMAGRRRAALQALADSQALDLPAARLSLAAWVAAQLADPTKETDR